MAFSMFLRNPACSSRIFTQQVMRLATQPSLQRAVTASLPARSLTLAETKSTPILNSVRSFRTTRPRLSEEKPHDHSKLWVIERAVTAAMVPVIPLALLMPNKLLDSVLAILITAHSFWSLEAMVVEYLRVLVVGHLVPKVAMGVVYFLIALNLGGLFFLIFNDIGLSRAYWKIWKNMRGNQAPPPVKTKEVKDIKDTKKPEKMTSIAARRGLLADSASPSTTHHHQQGLEAIAVDYVRASVVGPLLPKVCLALVYAVCAATLGGLFYTISHDVGIANAVRQFWSIKPQQKA